MGWRGGVRWRGGDKENLNGGEGSIFLKFYFSFVKIPRGTNNFIGGGIL
jgi:hypothetical protein